MNITRIFTIIKKELTGYLATTSNFLVLAGVLLVVTFMFFNSFYSIGISQLSELFNLLPWVFALLVPAVAMGIFARERQEKTITTLLSYPIREIELVVGKYLGAWLFLAIFPLVTLIIPISTGSIAQFDWGIIAAGYIGALLLIGLFLSVNMLISSLFTNSLAVFVVSFIANFILILFGTNQVGNIVPTFLVPLIGNISPVDHFVQLSRGLIRLSDVTYFLFTISAMTMFTLWQIQLLRGGKVTFQKITKGVSIQLAAIILIIAAYFSFLIPGRVDITQLQLFTLSSGTKNIMTHISDSLTFDVYLTKNLPAQFQPTVDDLKRLIEELQQIKSGKITVNWRYPEDDASLQQEAAQLGIYPQSFTVVSQTEYQAKEGYLGLNIIYNDQNETISFINQTDDLEFQVMSRINELTNLDKPILVYLKDTSNQSLDTYSQSLYQQLLSAYEVRTLTIPASDGTDRLVLSDLADAKIIVVANLIDPINPEDIQTIQAAVGQGVALLALDNGVSIDTSTLQGTPREKIPLNDLLTSYGVKINADVVYDVKNANVLTFTTQQGRVMLPYPFWPTVNVNEINPLLQDLTTIVIPWASDLTVSNNTFETILTTSQYGGIVTDAINLSPNQNMPSANLEEKTLGVYIPATETGGGIIVLGSGNLLDENYSGGTGNGLLLTSLLIDSLTQNSDLATIKTKSRIAPQLVFSSSQQKELIRYANVIGAPLIIVILGGVYILRRKKITQQVYRRGGFQA